MCFVLQNRARERKKKRIVYRLNIYVFALICEFCWNHLRFYKKIVVEAKHKTQKKKYGKIMQLTFIIIRNNKSVNSIFVLKWKLFFFVSPHMTLLTSCPTIFFFILCDLFYRPQRNIIIQINVLNERWKLVWR